MLFRPEYTRELTGNELKLLMIMKVMASGQEHLEATIETLTHWMAGCCTRTIIRTINSLIAKGYMNKEVPKGPHPTTYHFIK